MIKFSTFNLNAKAPKFTSDLLPIPTPYFYAITVCSGVYND